MYHDKPPIFTIDLSLPPVERYVDLALYFKEELRSLTDLFDQLVEDFIPGVSVKLVKGLARLVLRRLHRTEENDEIRGISRATGVDMYLMIAFNVLLDLLMGCTSGAARIKDPITRKPKMLHFRTLDWGMDELRDVVVQLDYIRSPSTEVLASSITYAGFVGVLTGIRQDLSMSVNFRPNHDRSTRLANFRYYFHHLLILLGIRPSISSHIRQCLIPSTSSEKPPTIAGLAESLPSTPTAACYLIFSDGTEAMTMEKDHRTAVVSSSTAFTVRTNHDVDTLSETQSEKHSQSKPKVARNVGMADVIEESTHRRACMLANWDRKVRAARQKQRKMKAGFSTSTSQESITHITRSRSKATQSSSSKTINSPSTSTSALSSSSHISDETPADSDLDVSASEQEIIKWTLKWPITNECTHFAAVLDPARGRIAWVRRLIDPVESPEEEVPRARWGAAERKKRTREEEKGGKTCNAEREEHKREDIMVHGLACACGHAWSWLVARGSTYV